MTSARISTLIFALALLAQCPARAAGTGPKPLEQLGLEDCTLQAVASYATWHDIEREAELATQAKDILELEERLARKATQPNVPVGKQLSLEDNNAFSQASQRLLYIQTLQLFESRRARDAEVFVDLVRVAGDNYKWSKVADEKSPDFVYQLALDLMRVALPTPELQEPAQRQCSMEMALYQESLPARSRLGAIDLRPASAVLQSMAARYGVKQLERDKLSAQDRATYDQLMNGAVRKAQVEANYLRDIERIKLLARASEMLFSNSVQDLADSGGDPDKVGTRLNGMIKDKSLPQPMVVALGVLGVIDQKVPSRMMVQLQQRDAAMKEYEKQSAQKK